MHTRLITMIALATALAACGGMEADAGGVQPTEAAARSGGTPTTPPTNPLPSTPPSPDMVIRESFGLGPDAVRPAGGKGVLKSTLFTGIGGFWVEYPGSAAAEWAAADQAWQFAGCSTDPFELPSPLQLFNACVVSPWADRIVRFPDAILPFAGLPGPYEVSADVYPGVLAGTYVAIGLTRSGATAANLMTSGDLWLLVRQGALLDGIAGEYELRTGGAAGSLLASGTTTLQGYNPIALRYDPVAQAVTATVNGVAVGPFPAPGVAPRYAAIEGQGVLDNFVVRSVP